MITPAHTAALELARARGYEATLEGDVLTARRAGGGSSFTIDFLTGETHWYAPSFGGAMWCHVTRRDVLAAYKAAADLRGAP